MNASDLRDWCEANGADAGPIMEAKAESDRIRDEITRLMLEGQAVYRRLNAMLDAAMAAHKAMPTHAIETQADRARAAAITVAMYEKGQIALSWDAYQLLLTASSSTPPE